MANIITTNWRFTFLLNPNWLMCGFYIVWICRSLFLFAIYERNYANFVLRIIYSLRLLMIDLSIYYKAYLLCSSPQPCDDLFLKVAVFSFLLLQFKYEVESSRVELNQRKNRTISQIITRIYNSQNR